VPEPAGPVDLATTAAEVLLVGVLMTMLGARAQRLTGDVVLGLAVLLWALRLTGHLP
jgi:steroid 5-alpha reductase family enzyme